MIAFVFTALFCLKTLNIM